MPLYPLYALLFADRGLSQAQVSGLFAVWSVTGLLAEVPTGILADRWSRRGALVLASLLEAAGFALWTALPSTPSFAAGFVLWGIGGALASGSAEALVYEGLAAAGSASSYTRVSGRIDAVRLGAQVPTAFVATGLFALGGYPLVGWASIGTCLVAASLATRLPEPRRIPADGSSSAGALWPALSAVLRRPGLRTVVLAAALLGGLDGVEEYWPLMAGSWGVPAAAVPVATLAIPLAGALGAALADRAGRLPAPALLGLLALAAAFLGAAALWARPAALTAVAAFYGSYCAVLVVVEARLQDRIAGPRRATITSVAGLGVELASLPVFAAWAVGGAGAVALLVLAAVPVVAVGLRRE